MPAPRRNREALTKLKYDEIQLMARKEGIKFKGKKSHIIDRLIEKYPDGVPRQATPIPPSRTTRNAGLLVLSASKTKPKPLLPPRHRGKRKVSVIGSSAEDDELDVLAAAQGGSDTNTDGRQPLTASGLRDIKRQLTRLVNAQADIEPSLIDLRDLSNRAHRIVEDITRSVRELVETRILIEQDVLGPFKDKRELWDGTMVMPDQAKRKSWQEYIDDNRREHARLLAEQEEQDELELERLEKERETKEGQRQRLDKKRKRNERSS